MEHRQPSAAEVARTLLTGTGTATLESAATQSAVPMLHAETASGTFILVGDQHTLAALGLDSPVNELLYRENGPLPDTPDGGGSAAAPAAGTPRAGTLGPLLLPVRLRISAKAPVLDLNVDRGEVRFDGTMTPLPPSAVPAALRSTCSGIRLSEVLGYRADARLFVLRPVRAEVSTAQGCGQVDAEELAGARPDPLAATEGSLLAAVESNDGGALLRMVHGLDEQVDAEELGFASLREVESVRAIGLDRYGLTLQCSWDVTSCIWRALLDTGNTCPAQALQRDGAGTAPCHNATATVRVPFPAPVSDPEQALAAVHILAGTYAPVL